MPFLARCLAHERFASVFMAVGALLVLAMALLVPPFQTPDESRHFFRAWSLSEGHMVAQRQEDAPLGSHDRAIHSPVGAALPLAIDRLMAAVDLDRLRFHGEERIAPSRILDALAIRTDPAERHFFRYPHSAIYHPLLHLPQAAAILAARTVSDRTLVALYAARLVVGLTALALFAAAMRAAPALRLPLLALWLMPMTQFLAASMAPDILLIGAAALLVARALRGTGGGGAGIGSGIGPADLLLGAFLAAKLAYAPMVLLRLFDRATAGRGAGRMARLLLIAVPLLAVAAWYAAVPGLRVPIRLDLHLSPGEQLQSLLADPRRGVGIFAGDLAHNGLYYLESLLGRLGWLDTALAPAHLAIVGLALLAAGFGPTRIRAHTQNQARISRPWLPGVTALAIVLAAVGATQGIAFLSFTPVGADGIIGVQGRYFLPLMPCAFLALELLWRDRPRFGFFAWLVPAVGLGSWIVTALAVAERYYGA